MNRKELMLAISLATGVALGTPGVAFAASGSSSAAVKHADPQGFAKSGNPKAAGGPENPGKGNPFNAY